MNVEYVRFGNNTIWVRWGRRLIWNAVVLLITYIIQWMYFSCSFWIIVKFWGNRVSFSFILFFRTTQKRKLDIRRRERRKCWFWIEDDFIFWIFESIDGLLNTINSLFINTHNKMYWFNVFHSGNRFIYVIVDFFENGRCNIF